MTTAQKRADRETESRSASERTYFDPAMLDTLPAPPPKDGEHLRWVAVGQPNQSNEHNRRFQGYVPVKYGDYPEFYAHLLKDDAVKPDERVMLRHDLVLMRLPKALADRRREAVERRTAALAEANDPRLRSTVPGLVMTDQSTTGVVTSGSRAVQFGR